MGTVTHSQIDSAFQEMLKQHRDVLEMIYPEIYGKVSAKR